MFAGYLCMNIDHGIMPAATDEIQSDLGKEKYGQSAIGLLGSLVYLGNALGSIIMTPAF